MSKFENQVELLTDQALNHLRRWDKEKAAKEVVRDYLNEEGLIVKSGSKLQELLDERHRLALMAEDDEIKLKAINSSLAMAAGPEKVTNVQNNQFNFGDFLNKCEE